jgi:hypothetical protein
MVLCHGLFLLVYLYRPASLRVRDEFGLWLEFGIGICLGLVECLGVVSSVAMLVGLMSNHCKIRTYARCGKQRLSTRGALTCAPSYVTNARSRA